MPVQTYYPGHEPGTYKAYKTIGGWKIKYLDEHNNLSDAPGSHTYPHRQNASRRKNSLNKKVKAMAQQKEKKEWVYRLISRDGITSTDLREEMEKYDGKIIPFLVIITGHAEQADGIYLPDEGRMGIGWGADATWADVDDIEQGIEMWANQPEEWEKRN